VKVEIKFLSFHCFAAQCAAAMQFDKPLVNFAFARFTSFGFVINP